MSTKLALTLAGGAVGLLVGQPGLGAVAGGMLGQVLSRKKSGPAAPRDNDSLALADISVQTSNYGQVIPLHFGRNRLSGQIIWATPIKSSNNKTYTVSFAIAFCQGPISGFGKIWCDSALFYDETSSALPLGVYASKIRARGLRFYLGTETQGVDPLILADIGRGKTPAYRGLAYIVFEDLNLTQLGNRIPQITVEVFTHQQNPTLVNPAASAVMPVRNSKSYASSTVFTAISAGALHLLTINKKRVQIFNPDGLKLTQGPVKAIDNYGTALAYSCGQLNGYLLSVDNNLQRPIGKTKPAALWVADAKGKRLFNLLAKMNLPASHYLAGFAISSNQARAVIITGIKTKAKPVTLQTKTWFLIRLSANNTVVIVAQGKATGLPDSDLAIGNHALDRIILGGQSAAVCLENDYQYLWRAQGERHQDLSCYRLTPEGIIPVFSVQHGMIKARPTIIADMGICWLANGSQVKHFRRDGSKAQAVPLAAVVIQLCQQVDLNIADIDVSQLNTKVTGFTIAQDASARSAIETLRKAYCFDGVEVDGVLRFIPRGQASVTTINENELAVHEVGQSLPDALTISRQSTNTLVHKVTIAYIQASNDYQRGLQSSVRQSAFNKMVVNMELPIVLTDTQAVRLSEMHLNSLWSGRETFNACVNYRYLYLSPGDVVRFNVDKINVEGRLTSVELGSPGLVQLQGVRELRSDYNSRAQAGIIKIRAQKVMLPSPTVLHCLDFNLGNNPGVMLAASGMGEPWSGCVVYAGFEEGSLREVATITQAATMGITITKLDDTVIVRLSSGQLASITEKQLLVGDNLACIGDEIVQFQQAILQNDGSYVLSQLLRGRHNTQAAILTHQEGERFVLLDLATLTHWPIAQSAIGQTFVLKAVSIGLSVADTPSEYFYYQGKHLSYFSEDL